MAAANYSLSDDQPISTRCCCARGAIADLRARFWGEVHVRQYPLLRAERQASAGERRVLSVRAGFAASQYAARPGALRLPESGRMASMRRRRCPAWLRNAAPAAGVIGSAAKSRFTRRASCAGAVCRAGANAAFRSNAVDVLERAARSTARLTAEGAARARPMDRGPASAGGGPCQGVFSWRRRIPRRCYDRRSSSLAGGRPDRRLHRT